ncbi:hypothetical protein JTB14_030261 [Gonioctena quinquepunctata]|nr:hypothetical protein JTB14_030261 [Gonioctena quinquepunctata]
MSLTQASDTENMQVKITIDKQSKNGDEQIEGMGVSDTPEFSDPAILLVRREVVKIRYTREELVKLRDVPLSKKKPDFFDEVSPSVLDPERWNFDRKKSESGTSENGGSRTSGGDGPPDQQHNNRRRPGDPRERVRKENDGIVLSPQRRSFKSGCFVTATMGTNRSHSPLGAKNDGGSHMGIREIQTGTRRIGSGRILRDSWDFDKPDSSSTDEYSFRGGPPRGGGNNNEREDKFGSSEKYERRSFGRDFDMSRGDRENNNKESRRNGRFDRRRITDHREQEEPEWFSSGPISQNDTIELRGFEESDKPGKKKLSPSRVKRAKEWSKKKSETQQQNAIEDKDDSKEPARRTTPTPQAGGVGGGEQPEKKGENDLKEDHAKETTEKTSDENKVIGAPVNDQSFNFDDILKCDSIPGLLTNGIGADGDTNTKSRFSRWFKQESPEKIESRRSSLHDDHIIKDLLKDIGETSVTIPGDSEAYFAPISPAANTGGIIGGKRSAQAQQQQQSQSINIMEMLQRGKQLGGDGGAKQQRQGLAGKILSLDWKKRQNGDMPSAVPQKHQPQKPDEEMAVAFKKLLAQAQAGGHPASSNGPINKGPPMSLLEMLSHSQQQDEAARMGGSNAHLLGPSSPNVGHHHRSTNDLTLKLQQAQLQQHQKQQMEMLNKLINATTVHPSQMRTSPLHDMGMQQSRELLNRPEAQAILQGLKRGEITTQHLYQQLSNPALQPRHREMLMTILKIQGAGYGPSPRVLSPVPPHHMFQQQQQQQLRVSPLPPNAMHQRIPSPRELQVHTQNILQRALIKKKLEEQQENYRKKQEMQRGQSPNTNSVQGPAKSLSSPTQLAFTPTSVLRKMTAEKDEGKENKLSIDGKIPPGRPLTGVRPQPQQPQGQQWNQQYASVKHPGRPIVKANNNYQTQTPEQFFSQHQQQQRMFSQPPPGVSSSAGQQQRKTLGGGGGVSQFGSNQGVAPAQYNPQQYSTNQQFTQQQLRAQHQHRPANQPQQQPSVLQQQSRGGKPQQQQQQGSQHHMGGPVWQQFFGNSQGHRNINPIGRSALNDGDLSPTTTNQLARWFSPDLLERARGGELPSTAGLAQHALSLEEIERQTAPPVHN